MSSDEPAREAAPPDGGASEALQGLSIDKKDAAPSKDVQRYPGPDGKMARYRRRQEIERRAAGASSPSRGARYEEEALARAARAERRLPSRPGREEAEVLRAGVPTPPPRGRLATRTLRAAGTASSARGCAIVAAMRSLVDAACVVHAARFAGTAARDTSMYDTLARQKPDHARTQQAGP